MSEDIKARAAEILRRNEADMYDSGQSGGLPTDVVELLKTIVEPVVKPSTRRPGSYFVNEIFRNEDVGYVVKATP